MKSRMSVGRPLAVVGVALVFCAAGCGMRDSDSGSDRAPFGDHNFRLLLTDFPLDDEEVTKVLVTFNRIEIHGEETGWFTAADYGPAGRTFDLLTLQDGRTDELGAFDLAPGTYTQIRLILAEDNLIEVDDGSGPELRPLKVPSGEQTGIKLQGEFIVAENGFTQVVLDFNAEKSVHQAGDKYMLHPVIHIVSSESFPGIEILSPPDNYQTQVPHVAVTGRVTNLITGPIQNVTATFAGETFPVPVQADGSFAFDLDIPIGDRVTALPLEVAGSDEAGHSARDIHTIIAVPTFAPEQVLVRFRPTSNPGHITSFVDAFDGTVIGSMPQIKLYQIALPPGTDVRQLLPAMNNNRDGVAYALPNFYATGAATPPRDIEYDVQDDLQRIDPERAWDTTQGSREIVVAVIDDGINFRHQDFTGNLFQNPRDDCSNGNDDDGNGFVDDCRGWDFVRNDNDPNHDDGDSGHGTAVASIIGARESEGSSSGMVGVNWEVTLLPIRVYAGTTVADLMGIVNAMEYAMKQEADIINMSFRGFFPTLASDSSNIEHLEQLFKDVNGLGTLLVMAAGNESLNLDGATFSCSALGFPMGCFYFPTQLDIPNKLIVGAFNDMDVRADNSNFGSVVNLSAPGESVLVASGFGTNIHTSMSGTSMAAAFVSGVAALTLAARLELRSQSILLRDHLLEKGVVDPVSKPRIDAFKAVDTSIEPLPLLKNPPRGLFPSDYRVNDTHLIPCDVDGDNDEDMVVVVGFAAGVQDEAQTLLFINSTSDDGLRAFIDGTHRLNLPPSNFVGGDCGDIDNDRDKDLVLAGFDPRPPGRRNKILINDSHGIFSDQSGRLLPDVIDVSRDIDLFDADNDGDLDMFVSNAAPAGVPNRFLLNQPCEPGQPCEPCEPGQPCLQFVDRPDLLSVAQIGDSHNAVIGDIDKDGDLDIYVSNELEEVPGSGVDQLLINKLVEERALRFVDEAADRGLPATDGYAHQGAFLDANRDGCLDLVVVQRHEQVSSLYLNLKVGLVCTGRFVPIRDNDMCFPTDRMTTSTLDVGDLNLDGYPDIYLGNGDPNVFVAQQDRLLINRGGTDGCYEDSDDRDDAFGVPQGVINTTKHVSFIDVDRDGDCDIWNGNFGERDGLLLNTTCDDEMDRPTRCTENLSQSTTPGVPDAVRNYCGLEVQFASPPSGG
jgi:subtilisin family serine protease